MGTIMLIAGTVALATVVFVGLAVCVAAGRADSRSRRSPGASQAPGLRSAGGSRLWPTG